MIVVMIVLMTIGGAVVVIVLGLVTAAGHKGSVSWPFYDRTLVETFSGAIVGLPGFSWDFFYQMTPADFFALLNKHFNARTRRVWMGQGRAHVELRLGDSPELVAVAEQLQREVERHVDLRWAEVHQATGRAVLAFRAGAFSEEDLVSIVTEAELRAGMARAAFDFGDHPADIEPGEKLLVELVVEALGLLCATGLRLSFIPRSRLAGTTIGALTVVRALPRLRRPLEARLGTGRTDLLLGLWISLLQAPAQRPLSALVGVLEKTNQLTELTAQRAVWERRHSQLLMSPSGSSPRPVPERPVAIPRGPIEEYSERAWIVALSGFGLSLLSTRSVQRAFAALFGGVPRPAILGRETFSVGLAKQLAQRSVLVLNRDALRRLDRIDCLVLQGNLVSGGGATVGEIKVREGGDEKLCSFMTELLFTPDAPLSEREQDGFRLLPLGRSQCQIPGELADVVVDSSREGQLVLSLERAGEIEAFASVDIQQSLGLEELIEAAHDASMKVIVASDDPEVLQSVPADDTMPGGESLWRSVRQLQREGRVVCVVAQGDTRALDVCDLGIALVPDGSDVPWAAHVLCRGELADVRLLIEASQAARAVSRQSVNIALGSATLGALASVIGILPMTTHRVLSIVNLAALVSMGNGVRLATDFQKKVLPPARDPTPWHALSPEGVLTRLGVNQEGLSAREVLARATDPLTKKSALAELSAAIGDEFFNPLVPLLAAGAGLSAVAGSVADAMMVGGVVGLNAVIGGVQRFRTERAISELAQTAKMSVLARRGGVTVQLSSEELVKGDIVLLGSGDLVPADCRILEAHALEVDAAGLTGESLPVRKSASASFEEAIADRSSMLYAGTSVSSGRVTAVVVATGAATEARRGVVAFRTSTVESGVERRMRELMGLTLPIALVAGGGVIAAGLFRGRRIERLVGSAVSLAVASVPEGLPLLANAAQLAAAKRLRDHGALVRNARSLEVLGRVDTVCVDKTGTVTEGSIELGQVSDGTTSAELDELPPAHRAVLAAALRACPARPGLLSRADPIDIGLWTAAESCGVSTTESDPWLRDEELPFDAARSYYAVAGKKAGGAQLLSVKGAPEVLLARCNRRTHEGETQAMDAQARLGLMQAARELAEQGLRVLAVAERSMETDEALVPEAVDHLAFVGFLAFQDPVRPTAKAALSRLRRAGLRPVMITGDHPSTAVAVAVKLGISAAPSCVTGAELSQLDEDQLASRVEAVDVFARVSPAQKVRIVRALIRAGRTVAMVGDGANDAPAIRLASVGVAMGLASAETTRSAADIVLTDARIETLVRAIVEGRAVWDSVRDAVAILIGGNLGEIGFTLLGGLVGGRPPLSPRQLLLVNLFTDVAPATALALRKPEEHELDELFESGPEASMGWRLNRDIGARALTTAGGATLAWTISSVIGGSKGASTTALLALVGTQLGQTLASGQRSKQVVATGVASALGLAAIVQIPGVSGAFGCRPLGPVGWAIAIGSSALATTAGRYAPSLVESFVRGPFAAHAPGGDLNRFSLRPGKAGVGLADVAGDL